MAVAEDRLDDTRRVLLADWCRLVGRRLAGETGPNVDAARTSAGPAPATPAAPSPAASPDIAALQLPPRVGQTLAGLLAGLSEKEIARNLAISPHTVHTYVKQLHKRLNVSSRGELLSRFVAGTNAGSVTR